VLQLICSVNMSSYYQFIDRIVHLFHACYCPLAKCYYCIAFACSVQTLCAMCVLIHSDSKSVANISAQISHLIVNFGKISDPTNQHDVKSHSLSSEL